MLSKLFLISLMLSVPFLVTVLVIISTTLPGWAFVLFCTWVLPRFGFWAIITGPVIVCEMYNSLIEAVDTEYNIVSDEGYDKALWVVATHNGKYAHGYWVKPITRAVVWEGHESLSSILQVIVVAVGLEDVVDLDSFGVNQLGSYAWSYFIVSIHGFLHLQYAKIWLPLLPIVLFWRVIRRAILVYMNVMYWVLLVICVIINLPSKQSSMVVRYLFRFVVIVTNKQDWGPRSKWFKLVALDWASSFILAVHTTDNEVQKRYSHKLGNKKQKLAASFRVSVMTGVKFIADIGLPSFIRNRFKYEATVRSLQNTANIMLDIGWPVNYSVVDTEPILPSFKDWFVCGSDFKTGLRSYELHIGERIPALVNVAQEFKRTETYQSIENELAATSRYFNDMHFDYPTAPVDDVWFVVKDIFSNSRLTPFNYIIKMWEKKYALGFFMKDPVRNKKYSRRNFINSIGYARFKEIWAQTFYYATMMLPVAHVSVKGEALPEKKWLANKVRSVIGSPIVHYIATTIFNYGPNHQFKWDTTPIKVGMPLNGYWMNNVFERHARHDIHIEGDFSEFDSTISGNVKVVIREVRKRGYNAHKDRFRICDLIDATYDQLDQQPLAHTTTGDVYRKGTGLTTGHSSTSMDNSLALVTLYVMAWKQLTGLSAKEFLHFNELSCFGDDHILSYSHARPKAWQACNITHVMSKWGVTNNLEEKKMKNLTFLHKHCSRPTHNDAVFFKQNGIRVPTFKIWHSKDRLVGKLMSRLENNNPTYRLKRLLSYLDLTCHHRDVYDSIVGAINECATMRFHLATTKLKIPSYETVVKNWYRASDSPIPNADEDDTVNADERVLFYGTPNIGDHLLSIVSLIPDLLNPDLFNAGYMTTLQRLAAPLLSWAVTFIIKQNDVVNMAHFKYVVKRTHYEFLDNVVNYHEHAELNDTTLLVRHWLYLSYHHFRVKLPRFKLLQFLLKKFVAVQFAINGILMNEQVKFELALDSLAIVCLLNVVHVPNWIPFLTKLRLPDLPLIIDLAWNRLLSFIWTNVPTNYREVDPLIAIEQCKVLVNAPTGTGKSTNFVVYLYQTTKHLARKIVVLEPRVLLAIGLSNFVNSHYGVNSTAGTGNSILDTDADIWYMTSGSFLSHLHLFQSNFIFVIDEAHIRSKELDMVLFIIDKLKARVLYVTATPTDWVSSKVDMSVVLNVANIWTVNTVSKDLVGDFSADYRNKVIDLVNSADRFTKIAVIFDTPEQAEEFSRKVIRTVQVLSSKHDPTVRDVQVYACTNVIDVGVTIPNLDIIAYPDWNYTGQGTRVALTEQDIRQRNGRVGRTRNGLAVLFKSNFPFERPVYDSHVSKQDVIDMMTRGIPLALIDKIDKSSVKAVVDDSDVLSEEAYAQLVKDLDLASHLWKPVLATGSATNSQVIGESLRLNHQRMGLMAHNKVGNGDSAIVSFHSYINSLIQNLKGVFDEDDEHLEKAAGSMGFAAPIRNFHSWLIEGRQDSDWHYAITKPFKEVQDMYEIIALLNDINELA